MEFISKQNVKTNMETGIFRIYFCNGKTDITISVNLKYKSIDIGIKNDKDNTMDNVSLKKTLEETFNLIDDSKLLVSEDELIISMDILQKANISNIMISNMKINADDIYLIKTKCNNLFCLETTSCIFDKSCNLGILKSNYIDNNSVMPSLDLLNGFNGKTLALFNSNIDSSNKNVLHINSETLKLKDINIDYKTLFLTLDVPNLKELIIDNKEPLTTSDLTFISGLYNLETLDIYAVIDNYDQINKLEKLRRIDNILCYDPKEINKTQKKRQRVLSEIGSTDGFDLKSYLMFQKMFIQQESIDFRNKLLVDRLLRVKWQNKINTDNLEMVKSVLEEWEKPAIKSEQPTYELISTNPLEPYFKYYRKAKKILIK